MSFQVISGGRRSLNDVVCEEVRVMMVRKGARQADVARALGVAQSGVSERLRGKREWTLSELEVLARLWQVPVAHLLGMTGENPRPGSPDGGSSLPREDSNLQPFD
jgi:transcriptional regulator with XRE-family HTH domain